MTKQTIIQTESLCNDAPGLHNVGRDFHQPVITIQELHRRIYTSLLYNMDDVFDSLLQRWPWSVSLQGEHGMSMAHIAASNGYTRILQRLVSRGISVEDLDSANRTPLDYALLYGHMDTVLYLLGQRRTCFFEKTRVKLPQDTSVFHCACWLGNRDVLSILLCSGHPELCVSREDKYGNTPLDYAEWNQQDDTIRWLFERSAAFLSTLPPDELSQTVHVMASKGQWLQLRALGRAGISLNVDDEHGQTPLFKTVIYGQDAVADFLMQHPDTLLHKRNHRGENVVHIAARFGRLEMLKKFIALHVAADEHSQHDKTPLHEASMSGYADIVSYLLDTGHVSLIHKERSTWSPLHLACLHGHLPVVNVLLRHGADIRETYCKETPFTLARQSGHADIILKLLQEDPLESKTTAFVIKK